MKKLFIVFVLLCIFVQIVSAQKSHKQAVDEVIAQKGANLFIECDKTLLEPKESARLSIIALLYPETIPGDETPQLSVPDETVLPPNSSIYKATNWRVLQGGGNLIGIDETTQTYTAPAKLPLDKTAVISVDLLPQRPNLPKIVLLQTIYFAENETAFVLNMPALGIVNSKYISKLDSGAKVPTVSPGVAQNLPPDARKKMEEAKKKMQQQSIDMDLSALSSNAVALYDNVQGFTAIRFSELGAQMQDGKINKSIGKEAILAFNFNGKTTGSYQIGEEKTGLGFYVTKAQTGFGCGDTQSATEKYPCRGTVKITEIDPKFVKGTVTTTVYTSVGDKIFRGSFYGKFKVNRAN